MERNAKPRTKVYEAIVSQIIDRTLKPGDFITQKRLVEISGFPLGAVREAIPRLEADGIVISTRQRGLQIATVSPGFIRNAYQLRIALEKEAFSAIVANGPDELIDRLHQSHADIIRRLDSELTQDLANEAQRVDWEMHDEAIGFLQNEVISEVYRVNAIKIRMAMQPQLQITPENLKRVMGEHVAIIEALRDRNMAATLVALERHLRSSMALALGR